MKNKFCVMVMVWGLAWSAAVASASASAMAERIVARYQVDLLGNARAIFALPPGPGQITTLIIEPVPGAANDWSRSRLRLVWDAEEPEQAAVEIPGTTWNGTRFELAMPMPYQRAGRLVIDSSEPIRGVVRVEFLSGQPSSPRYLHGQTREKTASGNNDPPTMYYWYSNAPEKEQPRRD